jgi:hypothetical protein
MSNEIQLTSANGYDVNNMIFSKPIVGNVKDTPINFRRINIQTKYEDGSVGDLILPTERVFSFGVCENVDPTTKKVNGYVFPLCLIDKDNPTDEEKEWVNTFNNIIDRCKKYLLDNKKELKLYDLEAALLKKLNPLYYKRVDGEIPDGATPTLYAKIIVSKKQEKVVTEFFDSKSGISLNALDLLKKFCYAKAAIKVESIFLGNKISIQIKIYEAEVDLVNTGMKKLLPRKPVSESKVVTDTSLKSNPLVNDDKSDVDDDDDVSSIKSDSIEEPEPVKAAPKKIIKKVTIKKVKKDE